MDHHNNYGNFSSYGNNRYGFKRPSLIEYIKSSIKNSGHCTKLIYINIAIFFLIKLLIAVARLTEFYGLENNIQSYICLSSNITQVLNRPWTLVSYMFVHYDFLHLLFNMMWLYWFASLYYNFFNSRNIVPLYIAGGLSGAALYLLVYNTLEVFSHPTQLTYALGASASVMAIVFAVCLYRINERIYLFLIGEIKLKYIALCIIIIDLLSIPSSNAGGHIAHIGGALCGLVYIFLYKNSFFNTKTITFIQNIFRKFSHSKLKNRSEKKRKNEINKILDKISKSGYDSLTKEEKSKLFKH